MKKLTLGILAHVDAGKTTLSEGLLYLCGCIRSLGRVDHRDTFLDTAALERERGITIFSTQAVLETPDMTLYLLDTPGHTDFSSEMERVLSVLDYAVLVISASDGVQVHTETLWRLLRQHGIPTFCFINKMDLPDTDPTQIMEHLHTRLSPSCINFSSMDDDRGLFDEQAAMCSEQLMEEYLDTGTLSEKSLCDAIAARSVFPCVFGSALKMEGVSTLLRLLGTYTKEPSYPDTFAAKVFKVGRDPQGSRLTWCKLTGGTLRVKTPLSARQTDEDGTPVWEEKIDQIRIYSGAKYKTVDAAAAGDICCVTGLSHVFPGHGLGTESDAPAPVLQPVLTYRLSLPAGTPVKETYARLYQLEEEDPMLHLTLHPESGEIHISLMGEIQMDVLAHTIEERFGLSVTFDQGTIVYRETLSDSVLCAGHFEPLRHYAEVHLLLEPGEPGSGVTFDSVVPENTLARNWQRLILSQLEEALPTGTLTGAELTDLRIVLTGGRAHIKHTEGGDFLQAATRALRQGLMKARRDSLCVLLEPWYNFRLTVPQDCAGRAISDLTQMNAVIHPIEMEDDTGMARLTGCAPAAKMHAFPGASGEARPYPLEVASYTRGRGRLSLTFHGYAPCREQDTVVASIGYEPEHDTAFPADSVFCHQGAGIHIPWQEAEEHMHVENVFSRRQKTDNEQQPTRSGRVLSSRSGRSHAKPYSYAEAMEEDRELREIFERTYGPISPRSIFVPPPPVTEVQPTRETYLKLLDPSEEYLLVDGYNIIFAWDELKTLARDSLDLARGTLIHILSNYQGYKKCNLILVFDAYRVKDGRGSVERHAGMYVIYTRSHETADTYIEKVTYDIGRAHKVRVATSDALEQVIVMGHGCIRVSAQGLHDEVVRTTEEIRTLVEAVNLKNR
ncbi:MAG: TetM/TetW/TetO/TetS family tetracycline resistance ribosomal protection protein [Clostridia bacterium]|nr:TetM/TetW/TetO/TetS family tetracycline resistance ribosomal protection protein [Clostridia bacterium]